MRVSWKDAQEKSKSMRQPLDRRLNNPKAMFDESAGYEVRQGWPVSHKSSRLGRSNDVNIPSTSNDSWWNTPINGARLEAKASARS